MKNILKLCGLLAIAFCNYAASAQVTIKSNDKSIRYDLIKNAHVFVKVTSFDTLGNVQYQFVNDNIIKTDSVNRQILFGRSRSIPFGHQYIDTSVTAYTGPLRYVMATNPMVKHLDVKFSPGQVQCSAIIKGVASNISTTMPDGYFDDNIVEDLMGYLPIKKGIKYQLDAYRFESDKQLNHFEIEYVFDDIIRGSDGRNTICSVLRFKNGYGNGYFWIDRSTRENIKEVIYIKSAVVLLETI